MIVLISSLVPIVIKMEEKLAFTIRKKKTQTYAAYMRVAHSANILWDQMHDPQGEFKLTQQKRD